MAEKQREPGFHWVRQGDWWSVAEWVNGIWIRLGSSRVCRDRCFDEIGERIVEHSETQALADVRPE